MFFQGKWAGKGAVLRQDKENIAYNETLEFRLLKTEPAVVLNIQSFTTHPENGTPMHTENGFVKVFPGEGKKSAEACYSHPFGMNEIEYGTLEDNVLILEASEESNFQRSTSGSKTA